MTDVTARAKWVPIPARIMCCVLEQDNLIDLFQSNMGLINKG